MSIIDQEEVGTAADAAAPETTEFHKLKKIVLEGQKARSYWRTEAIRGFDFVANHQWSEDDRKILEDSGRVPITFNRTAPIINAVCGLEVNNRQQVIYLPRGEGDGQPNELITATGKWVRDECYAEDEESEAFRDATICGEGWTDTRMEYDEEATGAIVEERVDPLEMGVNAGAMRANYKDARAIYRIRDLDPEDAEALFPDYDALALHADWLPDQIQPTDGGEGNKKDYPDKTRAVLRDGKPVSKCRVVQIQWWQREPRILVAQDGDTDLQEMTAEEFKVYKKRVEESNAAQQAQFEEAAAAALAAPLAVDQMTGQPIPNEAPTPPTPIQFDHVQGHKRVYYQAFLGRGVVKKEKLKAGMFTFRCITGYRDRTKKCFYGMTRDIFDPQMWANKWMSQIMHIINTNAKGGLLAEQDAFASVRKAEEDWADNQKIVWVKPGKLDKVKERTAPALPQGLGEMMEFAISSIRDVTGVNLEMLGQADREQAAALEVQRRQAAMTILAALFDALRRYRKAQGKLMLRFIKLLPDGTLIRISDKGLHKYVPLVKQGDFEKYDVIVDEAPSSPNQKEAVWRFVDSLLQKGIPFPPQTVVSLLKYTPLPESVVQEIAQSMGLNGEASPEQMKQQLQQAEEAMAVLQQQLEEAIKLGEGLENSKEIERLKVAVDSYDAMTKRLSVLIQDKDPTNDNAAPQAPGGGGSPQTPGDNGLAGEVAQLKAMMQQMITMMQPPAAPAV